MANIEYNDVEEEREAVGFCYPRSEYIALLRIRERQKNKKPNFTRQESWRYKRIATSWRRPKGIDSKMRLKLKSRPKLVNVGYGSPRMVRGLHPSGFEEKLVHNIKDLGKVNSNQVVRIGHTVGLAKRIKIVDKSKELGLRILNIGGVGKDELEGSKKTGV